MSYLRIDQHELLPFDLSAKAIMEQYLSKLKVDSSDYTFAANYLWLSSGSGFYAIIEDSFCFFLLTNGELSMLLPPIGQKDNALRAIDVCFGLMEKNNANKFSTKIEYADEYLLRKFVENLEEGTEIFDELEEYVVERSLVDYIYNCRDLIDLKGNNYSSKRNEINKFQRIHPNYQVEMLDPKKHAGQIQDLVNRWISDRMKYMPSEKTDAFIDGIYSERIAVKRMLDHYEELELIGIVIIINGMIQGFTAGERINQEVASVIIEKTDFNIFGCAQFIFREFAKLLNDKFQVAYINVGDDMGFENLKKVKLSYRPSRLVPKYTIYKRQ